MFNFAERPIKDIFVASQKYGNLFGKGWVAKNISSEDEKMFFKIKKLTLTAAKWGFLIAFLVFVVPFSTIAEDVLYCTGEVAGGIMFKNGKWKGMRFNVDRFTLKFSENWTRAELGGRIATGFFMRCDRGPDVGVDFLTCTSPMEHFVYNKENRRFSWVNNNVLAYAFEKGEHGQNNIGVLAGTCENF